MTWDLRWRISNVTLPGYGTSEGYKDRRPLVKHALIESWSVRFQNRSRIRLPKVPSSRRIPTISYVWPLPSNNSRRRARANLSYPDPKADGFTHQLQYPPESKSPDHPIQSRNAAALPRRASMGIDTVLGERPEHCVQLVQERRSLTVRKLRCEFGLQMPAFGTYPLGQQFRHRRGNESFATMTATIKTWGAHSELPKHRIETPTPKIL